jgi:hypothetical protein
MNVFEVGQLASFKSHTGVIRFVDDSYITLSLNISSQFEVKILIYPGDYDQVKLLKET